MKIATLSRHWSVGVELTKWYSARLAKDRRDKQDKTDGQQTGLTAHHRAVLLKQPWSRTWLDLRVEAKEGKLSESADLLLGLSNCPRHAGNSSSFTLRHRSRGRITEFRKLIDGSIGLDGPEI